MQQGKEIHLGNSGDAIVQGVFVPMSVSDRMLRLDIPAALIYETFQQVYPGYGSDGKPEALREWDQVSPEDYHSSDF